MKKKEKIIVFTVFSVLFLICLMFVKTRSSSGVKKSKEYFTFFDTVTYIYSYAGDSDSEFEKNSAIASSVLERYHRYLDIYHEYSGLNNLYTLNQNAGLFPVVLEEELIDFLVFAKNLCYETDGEMNIMMGSLLSVWHDCRNSENPYLPSYEVLEEASLHTDIENLVIDREHCTAYISDPLARIDVGAIGKGYATEKAAQALEMNKVTGYVINAGGNVRTIGSKPDGSSWIAGIKNPNPENPQNILKVDIKDCSCVTSGWYERFFEIDGVKYHHIIDKDTLYPASHFASVSVIAKDSAMADALSTALFCMPYEQGLALIEKTDGVEAVWISENGNIIYTENAPVV